MSTCPSTTRCPRYPSTTQMTTPDQGVSLRMPDLARRRASANSAGARSRGTESLQVQAAATRISGITSSRPSHLPRCSRPLLCGGTPTRTRKTTMPTIGLESCLLLSSLQERTPSFCVKSCRDSRSYIVQWTRQLLRSRHPLSWSAPLLGSGDDVAPCYCLMRTTVTILSRHP